MPNIILKLRCVSFWGRVVLAPQKCLCLEMEAATKQRCSLMQRGSTRQIYSRQGLSLKVTVSDSNCGTLITSSHLLNWTVTDLYGRQVVNSSLITATATYFRLPPYALTAGNTYLVSVSVSAVKNVVKVVVLKGSIVALMSGGRQQQINTDRNTSLDASGSYDEDQGVVSGVAAGLMFSWSCLQTAPLFAPNCTHTLHLFAASTADRLLVQLVGLSAVNSTSRITVLVSDKSSTRSSSAYVDVTVTSAELNAITFVSTPRSLQSVQTTQRLTILTTMKVVTACVAMWSTDDAQLNLPSASLTSTTQTFRVCINTASSSKLFLFRACVVHTI